MVHFLKGGSGYSFSGHPSVPTWSRCLSHGRGWSQWACKEICGCHHYVPSAPHRHCQTRVKPRTKITTQFAAIVAAAVMTLATQGTMLWQFDQLARKRPRLQQHPSW